MAKMASTDLVHIDIEQATAAMKKLAARMRPDRYMRAVGMALNNAIDASATEADKAVREEFAAPKAEVMKTLRVDYASRHKLQSRLRARGKASVELIHYKPTVRGNRAVSVKVLKSSRSSPIEPGGKQGILATQKNKKARVWIAKGHVLAMTDRDKNPIRILFGPSFLSRLSDKDVRARVLQKGLAVFRKALPRIAKGIFEGKIKA
jgi:hypothetical protein